MQLVVKLGVKIECRSARVLIFFWADDIFYLRPELVSSFVCFVLFFFFFQAEDGIRDFHVTGVQTCALPISDPAAQRGLPAELVLAADQFLIKPAGRVEDAARAAAAGDEARTVIAGYHWFTDWGRDTMISLEGLTLSTGRFAEAGYILRTFATHIRDGLIPNLFPEGEKEGLYHTADATLWFFHALERYGAATRDRATLEELLPKLVDIANHHVQGTRFGIGIDPNDGLLKQGADG